MAYIIVKLVAAAATIEPTAKNNEDKRMSYRHVNWQISQRCIHIGVYTCFLPNTWLKPAMTGWKTAEVTRNDVPDQKASMAVPRSFSVMMGRAIERDVASSAAARVMIQMLIKAKRKPLPGLKAGWKVSVGGIAGESLELGED